MKISVKGSQDGSWGLTQKYLKDRDYHTLKQKKQFLWEVINVLRSVDEN